MIVSIDGRVLHQHFDDGGNREQVGDPVALNQLPEHRRIQLFAGHQHVCCSTRHVEQGVNAGSVRQGRNDDRYILLGRTWNDLGKMIGYHKGHLAMSQNARLGLSSGAGCVEKPERIIIGNRHGQEVLTHILTDHGLVGMLSGPGRADTYHMLKTRIGIPDRIDMPSEVFLIEHAGCTARGPKVGNLRWCQTKIRRHPHTPHLECDPANLKHLKVVA